MDDDYIHAFFIEHKRQSIFEYKCGDPGNFTGDFEEKKSFSYRKTFPG